MSTVFVGRVCGGSKGAKAKGENIGMFLLFRGRRGCQGGGGGRKNTRRRNDIHMTWMKRTLDKEAVLDTFFWQRRLRCEPQAAAKNTLGNTRISFSSRCH